MKWSVLVIRVPFLCPAVWVCVSLRVCVFPRDRVVGARERATTLQQHREGERGGGGWRGRGRGHTAVSGHRPTSTPVGLSTSRLFSQASAESPERRYGTEPREGGKDTRREGGGERGGRQVRRPPPPLLASLHRSLSSTPPFRQENG